MLRINGWKMWIEFVKGTEWGRWTYWRKSTNTWSIGDLHLIHNQTVELISASCRSLAIKPFTAVQEILFSFVTIRSYVQSRTVREILLNFVTIEANVQPRAIQEILLNFVIIGHMFNTAVQKIPFNLPVPVVGTLNNNTSL